MNELQTKIETDTWVTVNWDEYIAAINQPNFENAKSYYDNGQLRIEMSPVGYDHASDNTIILFAVNLFCTLKNISIRGLTNCSYRKMGVRECQPDISYYIGERANLAITGTSIIDLNNYPAPELVIEIASTSLADDLGKKRLMYESLDVAEYWIIDVQNAQIVALAISDGGSKRIYQSQVLPELEIALLEETLQRSRQMDNTQVGAWLLAYLQNENK